MNKIWDSITTCLGEHLSGAGYQTFLSSSSPISYDDNILTLEVPNEFSKEWIRDKCEPILREMLSEGPDLVFIYVINKKNPRMKARQG